MTQDTALARPRHGDAANHRRQRLALRYAGGAALVATVSMTLGGWAYAMFWPAASLLAVAGNYAVFGACGFCKNKNGRMPPVMVMLLAPYVLGAWINSRIWTRKDDAAVEVRDGVFLGRFPLPREARQYQTIIDLCAELPAASRDVEWHSFAMLDLAVPDSQRLRRAALAIDDARKKGNVLVCCALGYSRSAAALATWLLMSGHAKTTGEAVDQVQKLRPRIALSETDMQAIGKAAKA
jgi:hypothetical protein